MNIKETFIIILILISNISYSQDSLKKAKINYCQDSTYFEPLRIGPNWTREYIICDGVPFHKIKGKTNLKKRNIDTIIIHKNYSKDCLTNIAYSACIEVRTKESINQGLKKILNQTNNWIFKNPHAELYLNDRKTNWKKGYKLLSKIDPDLIYKIELVDAYRDLTNCHNGIIKIWIKKK